MSGHAAPDSDTIRAPRLNLEPIEEARARGPRGGDPGIFGREGDLAYGPPLG